jgi:hypothetical protein
MMLTVLRFSGGPCFNVMVTGESSPPAHSNVVGSPACTVAGTWVKAMLAWAWASATKYDAPRRRLFAKYIMMRRVEGMEKK